MSPSTPKVDRLLIKLRDVSAFAAADPRANLRPLYATTRPIGSLGLASGPSWYMADLAIASENPWDLAHQEVAAQLGIGCLGHSFRRARHSAHDLPGPRRHRHRRTVRRRGPVRGELAGWGWRQGAGPDRFAWHLEDDFTQLRPARGQVNFTEPRTRIAHLDTGYYPAHETARNTSPRLERNFVDDGATRAAPRTPTTRFSCWTTPAMAPAPSASSRAVRSPPRAARIWRRPGAEMLPLRIADSVVLLRTSAFAEALDYAVEQRCDVVTMSMGGLPSRAWARRSTAPTSGLCICAAAGNNIGLDPAARRLPGALRPRARGVRGDGERKPYAELEGRRWRAISARSAMDDRHRRLHPQHSLALFGCPENIRLNGEGTSAATPQVAAAAALWFEKYKDRAPARLAPRRGRAARALQQRAPEERPEAVRERACSGPPRRLRSGPTSNLPQTKSTALVRLPPGHHRLGVVDATPREKMFNLELAQRWLLQPAAARAGARPRAHLRLDGPS